MFRRPRPSPALYSLRLCCSCGAELEVTAPSQGYVDMAWCVWIKLHGEHDFKAGS